jgi:hypothetical protein
MALSNSKLQPHMVARKAREQESPADIIGALSSNPFDILFRAIQVNARPAPCCA